MPPTSGQQNPTPASEQILNNQTAAKPSVGIRITKVLFVLMTCFGALGIVGFFSIFLLPGDIGLILVIFGGASLLLHLGAVLLVGGIVGLLSTRFLPDRWRLYGNLVVIIVAFGIVGVNSYNAVYLPHQADVNIPTGLFGPTAASIPPGFHKNSQSGGWSNSLTDAGYNWSYSNMSGQQALSDPSFMSIGFKEDTYTEYNPPTDTSYFASNVDPRYTSGNAPPEVLNQIQSQPFVYDNAPGIVFSYPAKYTTGTADNYVLYWSDEGRQLQIQVTAPVGSYSAQQAIDILQTMQHYGTIPPLSATQSPTDLAAPLPGLLLPTAASIPDGFTLFVKKSPLGSSPSFTKTGYGALYQNSALFQGRYSGSEIIFSETLSTVKTYESQIADAEQRYTNGQSFTFGGSAGEIFPFPAVSPPNITTYHLYWNDNDNTAQIDVVTIPDTYMSAQDVINLLGTMRRSDGSPYNFPVGTPASASSTSIQTQQAPKTTASTQTVTPASTPCTTTGKYALGRILPSSQIPAGSGMQLVGNFAATGNELDVDSMLVGVFPATSNATVITFTLPSNLTLGNHTLYIKPGCSQLSAPIKIIAQ